MVKHLRNYVVFIIINLFCYLCVLQMLLEMDRDDTPSNPHSRRWSDTSRDSSVLYHSRRWSDTSRDSSVLYRGMRKCLKIMHTCQPLNANI